MSKTNENRLHDFLSQVIPFSSSEITEALPHFTFHSFPPNKIIFSQGDFAYDVHFLLKGIGRYYYIDREGRERNKSLVKSGGAFASISTVVEQSPSPFFTQALTACNTASIKYSHLIELSMRHTNWACFVRVIYERLALKKEKREASFLLLSARERYEQYIHEFGEESEHIPLYQVAMYLGITDVSLSRIRREMGLT